MLDGDTGFGNFNSFRRLVTKLEQRGVAGVCIEDKIFPKTNSFIDGDKQPLADYEEFCGKIKAGKDTQKDEDFIIISRIESFIAGWGLEVAMQRAFAYADAGADAILVHSKISNPEQIEAFMDRWDGRKPIVIVPTMYFKTPTQKFRDLGIAMAIWANHTVRASITNMQKIVKQIYDEESLQRIQEKIVPVKEIFRLQDAKEYKDSEGRYLPRKENYKGLILAAKKAQNFGTLTDDKPKAMIKIGDEPILSRIVKTFNARQIKDISVVVGYKKEKINLLNLKYITNEKFVENKILYSIYKAKHVFDGPVVMCFGDVLFEEDVLRREIKAEGDIVLAVDATKYKQIDREKDLVKAEMPYSNGYGYQNVCRLKNVKVVKPTEETQDYDGEFIGLVKLSEEGSKIFNTELELLATENHEFLEKADITDFINYLIDKKYSVNLCYFLGHGKDIDSIEDLTYLINVFSEETTK